MDHHRKKMVYLLDKKEFHAPSQIRERRSPKPYKSINKELPGI